jgi:hypothetical protein
MSSSLVVNSSSSARIRELRDFEYQYDNAATVTVEIRDSLGDLVTGETWPKVMPNINTCGTYQVFFDPALGIVAGDTYKQIILVVNATNFKQTQFVNYITAVESAGC